MLEIENRDYMKNVGHLCVSFALKRCKRDLEKYVNMPNHHVMLFYVIK